MQSPQPNDPAQVFRYPAPVPSSIPDDRAEPRPVFDLLSAAAEMRRTRASSDPAFDDILKSLGLPGLYRQPNVMRRVGWVLLIIAVVAMIGPWVSVAGAAAWLGLELYGAHQARARAADGGAAPLPAQIRAAMLRYQRCACCSANLARTAPAPDGCTVCARCGSAWRLCNYIYPSRCTCGYTLDGLPPDPDRRLTRPECGHVHLPYAPRRACDPPRPWHLRRH